MEFGLFGLSGIGGGDSACKCDPDAQDGENSSYATRTPPLYRVSPCDVAHCIEREKPHECPDPDPLKARRRCRRGDDPGGGEYQPEGPREEYSGAGAGDPVSGRQPPVILDSATPVGGCAPRCPGRQCELEEDDDAEQTRSGDANLDVKHQEIVSDPGRGDDPTVLSGLGPKAWSQIVSMDCIACTSDVYPDFVKTPDSYVPALVLRRYHSHMQIMSKRRRWVRVGGAVAAAGLMVPALVTTATSGASADGTQEGTTITSTGLKAGQVKHVWLIILENKSYNATFTGLNQNSYLWKTLPSQGVLLKNYFGTGHSSQDNYESMVSGQGPQEDTQSDCGVENFDFGTNASILTTGANRGQVASPANAAQPSGANAPNGTNGCTYPTDVPTLFNQLDAAGKTWKGYNQDLGNQAGRDDAACGGPGTAANNPSTNPTYLSGSVAHPLPAGVISFTGAQANDQYVAKHSPFPWFHSLTGTVTSTGTTTPALTTPVQGGTDCDAAHVANLDNANGGLYKDLQKSSTTPAFSWITPNNCSDAHDAVCKGNNLSGSFASNGEPIYQTGTPNPQSTTPKNYTGGLYASDLFLEYYIPMIEKSAAFKDGGLIDITFDEGNPAFTYSGNSFNNANAYAPTQGDQPNASAGISADAAGENLFGKNVPTEPTGPNSTLGTNTAGNQLYPGPGNNSFVDRPPVCTQTTSTLVPANCVPGIVRAGSGNSPGARKDTVAAGTSSTYVLDSSILADDTGRGVTDTVDTTGPGGTSPIPADTFVGTVSDTGPQAASSPSGSVINGSFQLVDQSGSPVKPTGAVSAATLSAEGAPGFLSAGQTADPLYDATDATPGGGDTGSVLISPLIKPGTTTSTFYNHYSWLATMEDVLGVSSGHDHATLPAGTVSGGLDGKGHLGFAAQAGLAPFGPDVFNNVPGRRQR